jgi:hypothetical protein
MVPQQILVQEALAPQEPVSVLLGKKYKPVAEKITPVLGELPVKFCIEMKIIEDPLANMPVLETHPPDFVPNGHYTEERMKVVDESHNTGFLEPEEVKLAHHLLGYIMRTSLGKKMRGDSSKTNSFLQWKCQLSNTHPGCVVRFPFCRDILKSSAKTSRIKLMLEYTNLRTYLTARLYLW